MMVATPGDTLDPAVEAAYRAAIDRHAPDAGDCAHRTLFF